MEEPAVPHANNPSANGNDAPLAPRTMSPILHVLAVVCANWISLEAAPEYVPTMQAHARLAVREGRHDEKVSAMINSIGLRGGTP